MFRALAAVSMVLLAGTAQACLFARNAQPKDWDQWAQALFAADVTGMQEDRARALDVITLRVVETFKGPQAATATLQIPANMWAGCKLERPQVGSHVLGALNANGDALLVPLSAEYAARLRNAAPIPPPR